MVPVLVAAITFVAAADAPSAAPAGAPAPATPQTVTVNAPRSASATDKAKSDPDHVVCRIQPLTGSRFNKRVCMTQAHWDALAKTSRDYLENLQRQTGLGMPNVPGQMN